MGQHVWSDPPTTIGKDFVASVLQTPRIEQSDMTGNTVTRFEDDVQMILDEVRRTDRQLKALLHTLAQTMQTEEARELLRNIVEEGTTVCDPDSRDPIEPAGLRRHLC